MTQISKNKIWVYPLAYIGISPYCSPIQFLSPTQRDFKLTTLSTFSLKQWPYRKSLFPTNPFREKITLKNVLKAKKPETALKSVMHIL